MLTSDVATERAHLVSTLLEAGPEAPTLVDDWTTQELASHVAAQDRFGGWPARLARSTVAVTGVRLSAVYLNRPQVAALVNGPTKPWAESLGILSKPPPPPIVTGRVAVITLWEHFTHHEDVRRRNQIPRRSLPNLEPVLEWILQYNRHRLNRRVRVVSDGRTLEAGSGDPMTITGKVPDLVLWLSGRPIADVQAHPGGAEADSFRRRLGV